VSSPYAGLVAVHGLAASHRLLVEEVPPGARVLDVGCASGYVAAELVRRGCEVVGVEVDGASAARARAICASVVAGDIEEEGVRVALTAQAPFGAIVCGDVLEHLRSPERVLALLASLLAPGGLVVASLPNVAHWTGRRALLRGRFPYADHGLFDRTHLRFFTRASARELVEGAGLRMLRERFAPAPLPLQARVPALRRLEGVAARAWPELFALQFVLTAERRA
jgi:2-polyprenyl-3-methyl-5-hydroxy-6-metoxy-1,4-benzoquinol methylase